MSEFEKLIEEMLQQCVELRKRHPGMVFNVWVPKRWSASIMFRLSNIQLPVASIGVLLDGRDDAVSRRGRVEECIRAIDDYIDREMAV